MIYNAHINESPLLFPNKLQWTLKESSSMYNLYLESYMLYFKWSQTWFIALCRYNFKNMLRLDNLLLIYFCNQFLVLSSSSKLIIEILCRYDMRFKSNLFVISLHPLFLSHSWQSNTIISLLCNIIAKLNKKGIKLIHQLNSSLERQNSKKLYIYQLIKKHTLLNWR